MFQLSSTCSTSHQHNRNLVITIIWWNINCRELIISRDFIKAEGFLRISRHDRKNLILDIESLKVLCLARGPKAKVDNLMLSIKLQLEKAVLIAKSSFAIVISEEREQNHVALIIFLVSSYAFKKAFS